MRKLIIFGTTRFAQLAAYYFSMGGECAVEALTVDREFLSEERLWGIPVTPFETVQEFYSPDEYDMFVAIGYTNMNRVRERKCAEAIDKGYTLASYISSQARVFDTFKFGYNCFVLEGNVIQPFAVLGNNVVLMNGNLISHHCLIGNHCYIAANVTVCGGAEVGDNSFLGACSCIRDGITVAPYSLIGACSYISKNTQQEGVYMAESTKRNKFASSGMKI